MFHPVIPACGAGMAVACAAACFTTPVSAAVVLDDTFDAPAGAAWSATPGDDTGDPRDIAWYGFQGSGVSIDTASGDGRLYISPAHSFSRHASATFQAVNLELGESIRLSFDAQAELPPNTSQTYELRIGLFDSKGTVATDESSASRNAAADDQGVLLQMYGRTSAGMWYGRDFPPTLGGDAAAHVPLDAFYQAMHHFELVITAISETHDAIQVYQDGVLRLSHQLAASRRFDNLQFGTGVTPHALWLDNIKVEHLPVPEPATATLGALGAMMLLSRRRR